MWEGDWMIQPEKGGEWCEQGAIWCDNGYDGWYGTDDVPYGEDGAQGNAHGLEQGQADGKEHGTDVTGGQPLVWNGQSLPPIAGG